MTKLQNETENAVILISVLFIEFHSPFYGIDT